MKSRVVLLLLTCLLSPCAQASDNVDTIPSPFSEGISARPPDARVEGIFRDVAGRTNIVWTRPPIVCLVATTPIGPSPMTFSYRDRQWPEGQRAFVMLLTNSVLHYTELEFTGLFAHGFAYLLQDGIKPTTREGVIAQHIAQDNAAAGWVGCEPVLAAIDAAIRVLIPLSRAESRDFYSEQMERRANNIRRSFSQCK